MKTSLRHRLIAVVWLALLLPAILPASHAATSAFQHQRLAFLSGINVPNPYFTEWFEGTDGRFYATATSGSIPVGIVYRVNRDGGGLTPVYSDYTNRLSGVIMGQDGLLYGGVFNAYRFYPGQPPRIFCSRMAGDPSPRDLKVFPWHQVPTAGVIQGGDGWLYGTTIDTNTPGRGTIFRLSTNGQAFTTLHEFGIASNDGATPGTLVIGTNGWLYGCTFHGGISNYGTVFTISPLGGGYRVLHRFDNSMAGGANPVSHRPLLVASDGYLYGAAGGGTNRAGLLFRISHQGSDFKSVHQFAGENGLGDSPYGGLVEWCDGALYGTTEEGGIDGAGMVFKVGKDGGNFTALKVYIDTPNPGDTDGTPRVPLVLGSDHRLYGLTTGGSVAQGTLYRIDILPALSVRDRDGDFYLSWPDCADQFVLQSTSDVCNHASWQPVNVAPQTHYSDRWVILPKGSDHRFFRLVRP